MSVNDRFNLFWITRAMTISCRYDLERYYYDTMYHNLFSIVKLPSESVVLDKYNSRCDMSIETNIALRMAFLAGNHSSIIEIPRLSVRDKKEIQFQFLSLSSDKFRHDEYILAVSEQPDEDGFVLDTLLSKDTALPAVTSDWEMLKFQLSYDYMHRLGQSLGQINYLSN